MRVKIEYYYEGCYLTNECLKLFQLYLIKINSEKTRVISFYDRHIELFIFIQINNFIF
jgi:hypothetical protein